MATEAEIAWAAGLFEGEGCVVISLAGHRTALEIVSTDHDVLERFQRVVGVGYIVEEWRREDKPHWKPAWRWRLGYRREVVGCAIMLRPWLGHRRGAKIDELLRFEVTRDRKSYATVNRELQAVVNS